MLSSVTYLTLIYCLCAIGLPAFTSCENNLNTVNIYTAKDKTPLQVEDNAFITWTDSAKTKFTLTASRIESYGGKDPFQVFPKGIHIDFYNDSSKINAHLDAGYAIRRQNTELTEADNNIIVVNRKGEQLNTEQLFWDRKKDSVYTHKFVKIRTATEIIYGDGLISNDEFTKYRITHIKGTITLNNYSE